jgi:hypothetical protein
LAVLVGLAVLIALVHGQKQPKPNLDQAMYKEWAKTLRAFKQRAKQLSNRTPSQQNAWFRLNWNQREAELIRKYESTEKALHAAARSGVLLKWPTDSPVDRKAAQEVVDPMIYQEELNSWLNANPANIPKPPGIQSAPGTIETQHDRTMILPEHFKNAPVVECAMCSRKTIGNPGSKCYEHRAVSDALD